LIRLAPRSVECKVDDATLEPKYEVTLKNGTIAEARSPAARARLRLPVIAQAPRTVLQPRIATAVACASRRDGRTRPWPHAAGSVFIAA
jgi:hypothetical protein